MNDTHTAAVPRPRTEPTQPTQPTQPAQPTQPVPPARPEPSEPPELARLVELAELTELAELLWTADPPAERAAAPRPSCEQLLLEEQEELAARG